MKLPLFTGTCTAIVTPFDQHGINLSVFDTLLERQLAARVSAIVICGTTGESAALSDEEKLMLVQHAVAYVSGRCKIIAGTGSNYTAHAIHLSKLAQAYGADGLLVVTPYYNKTTQTGLIAHYQAIADHVSIPLIIYNVPSRTGMSITAQTYAQLSQHPNICGVKEASGDFALVGRAMHLCGDDLIFWSGNDAEIVPMMALGGKGVISTVANLAPERVVQLTTSCLCGDFNAASAQQLALMDLIDAAFLEVNPIPVKAALQLMGYAVGACRPPLCALSPENLLRLRSALNLPTAG